MKVNTVWFATDGRLIDGRIKQYMVSTSESKHWLVCNGWETN